MFRKIFVSGLVLVTIAAASIATTGTAEARYWHGGGGHSSWGRGGWGHGGWGGGGAVVGGVAAGLLGGALLGSAIANQNDYYDDGPDYYDAPVPVYAQRCHIARERVANQYDSGSHIE